MKKANNTFWKILISLIRLGYAYVIDGQSYSGTSTVIGTPLFIKPDRTD